VAQPNLLYTPEASYNAQGCGVSPAWRPGAPVPAPVARAAGAWFPSTGRFYVLGGRGADTPGTEHLAPYAYDPQSHIWLTASTTFDDARVNNLVAGVLAGPDGPRIYTVGGSQAGVLTTTSAVRVYDPINDMLTVLASDPWPGNPTQDALPGGAAVVNNKLYVLGGYRPGIATLDTIWEFDPNRPAGARWALMPVTLLVGLMHIPATAIDNVIYTAGGVIWDGATFVDTQYAYRYDPAAQTITALADVPRPSSETGAVTVGGKLWLLGGGFAAPTNAIEIYDPATNTWSAGLPFATARRMAAADVDPATGRLFIAGGYAHADITGSLEMFVPETPCGR